MLTTTIDRDPETGVIAVGLKGDLTLADFRTARHAIGKAAAECPCAVLVDLSSLSCADSARLNVFATITHQAQTAWGVPVLLHGAGEQVRRELAAFRTFVALYEHEAQAMVAVNAYVPRWVRRRLPPVATSAAVAREVVAEACSSWDLEHLRDSATLAGSELASNAITHARTEFDVVAGFTGRFLRIAVQDGSRALPRLPPERPAQCAIIAPGSGRGLRILHAVATHWGVTEAGCGKIVWALFRAARG